MKDWIFVACFFACGPAGFALGYYGPWAANYAPVWIPCGLFVVVWLSVCVRGFAQAMKELGL